MLMQRLAPFAMTALPTSHFLAFMAVAGLLACGGSDAERIVAVEGRPLAPSVLNDLRREFPAVYAREVPRIERVVARNPTPDNRRGLAITLSNPAAELPCADGVAAALELEYRGTMARVFAGRPPENVSPSEAADYFDWVRLQNISHALVVAGVARFSMPTGGTDPRVASHVRSWLIDEAPHLATRGVCSVWVPMCEPRRLLRVRPA